MKRIIFLIITAFLCLSLVIALSSCNKNEADESDTTAKHDVTENSTTASADNVPTGTTEEDTTAKDEPADDGNINYSVMYLNTSDDAIYIIEYNKQGLPVAVYYDESIYGEGGYERRLEYAIEYGDNGLISKVSTEYDYFEFTYDGLYATGIGYQSDQPKKMVSGDSIVIAYGNDMKIKSISYYHNYRGDVMQLLFDENGKACKLIDGKYVNEFTYDKSGRFLSCVLTNLEDGSKNNTLTFTYSGNSTLPSEYTLSNDKEVILAGTDLAFADNGKVISAKLTFFEDNVAEYIVSNKNAYNDKGMLVSSEMREIYPDGSYEDEVYLAEIKYNEQGLVCERSLYMGTESNLIRTSKTAFEYNELGNLTLEAHFRYEADGETVRGENSTVYTYNEMNLIVSEIDSNGDGTYYTYNEDGLKLSSTTIYDNGNYVSTIDYKWEFDSHDRLVETRSFRYEYDDKGRIIAYHDLGSGVGNETVYEYVYDSVGRIITVRSTRFESSWDNDLQENVIVKKDYKNTYYTFDENGNLVKSSIESYDYKSDQTTNKTYHYVA